MTERSRLSRVIHALVKASAWPGRMASWAVVVIMILTVLTVVFSQLRFGVIATWETSVPLLGNRITLAGLTELQWHFFGLLVMLGGAYALQTDTHIRVDIFYANLGPRGQRVVDVLGDVLLLLPFCVIITYYSLGYVERAFVSGERSDYGGLRDRYLVKSLIPIGLTLLGIGALLRTLRNLLQIFGVMEMRDEAQDRAGGTGT